MPRRIDSQDGPSPLLPLILVLAAGLLHWRVAHMAGGFLADGSLADPDSWTRILRVLALHEGAGWHDGILRTLSAPDGLSLHWTRPLDVMILAPARIAMAFGVEPREAILWSGAWVCPAQHLLALAAGVWAAKALWPGMPAWFAAVLLLGNGAALAYSVAGAADHHTLILLAALVTLGAGMRAAINPERGAQAWLAGFAGGFGIWISPEALLTVAPLLAGLGLAWLLAWDGHRHALQGLRASAGLGLMLALAIGTERPFDEWLLAEQDRVSIQHLAMAAAAAATFLLAAPLGRLPVWARLPAGAILAAAAGAALVWQWPELLRASLGAADAGAAALLLPGVDEMQPLRFGTLDGLADSVIWAGTAPLALLALALGLEFEGWSRNGRWTAALMVLLSLLTALAATLMARRFSLDLAAPAAIGAAGLLPLLGRLLMGPSRVVAVALFAALLLGLPVLAGLLAAPAEAEVRAAQDCPTGALVAFLAAHPPAAPGAVMLADNVNLGPELAWRTPYRQTAAPYHRGGAALLDTSAVLAATEDSEALAILARRSVRLLLLCRAAPHLGGPFAEDSFRSRLLAGARPEGWTEVTTSQEVTQDFLLLSLD
ncbi:hypothetical protein [Plastoroseomonas arctica]|uniref:Uncharacterized protein n=1 Tax=Plastoroseomonas arctica TaxID=1509237 RepID=A0AAF1KN51_9PROT|nr:hypothetical protein [Plastoroseomonas arctica]MBR0654148.1 hypothetical protein [Plastoroseomonas arctica]